MQSVDLDVKLPGRRELELFVQVVGADALIDTEGKLYGSRGLAYMDFDPVEELEGNPGLFVTPIVRNGRTVVVGDSEAEWRRVASADVGPVRPSGGQS